MAVDYGEDFLQRIVAVHWPKRRPVGGGTTFAVCGYDGNFKTPPVFDPIYFGVGAYSDDGKSWTLFKVFEDGSTACVLSMRDPNVVVAGGCTNQRGEGFSNSTAALTTVVGSGISAGGGTVEGNNVANFGSLGYDKNNGTFYAVENSGPGANSHILHKFQIGAQKPFAQSSIFWAGAHYPEIEPVYDCTCVGEGAEMKFKGKNGNEHTLNISFDGEPLLQLFLDGTNITPSGARHVISAAGGVNDKGENIIIAVGYSLKGTTDDHGIAWWSIDGQKWTEIEGLWTEEPTLQTAQMAVAVPS